MLDIQLFLKEIIMQIILATTSESATYGPYVPRVYGVGYDPVTRHGYIVSELMRGTLNNLIGKLTAAENDIVIPSALDQLAHILDFFGEKLQFNHRDFKDDNIMYVREGDRRLFKIIDFGFSCLKWNNLQIAGGNVFQPSSTCFKRERDLAQLLYNIIKFTPNLSASMREWLTKALMAEVGKEKCSIVDGCEIHGKKIIKGWGDTYTFFDRSNVHPLYAAPPILIKKIKHLREKTAFNTPVAEPRRSITRNSKKTGTKACSPGKIRNPQTGRCVKVTGSLGHSVAVNAGHPANALVQVPIPEQKCEAGKIFNPATGRCVKANGAIGRALMKAK
jgi:serine/threonine protein kinase